MTFLLELFAFIRQRKRYWLVPIVIVALIICALLVAAQTSAIAPFIYTLF